MKKRGARIITILLMLTIILTAVLTVNAEGEVRDQWVDDGTNLYYMDSYGSPYIGWHKMKPYGSSKVKWCWFDDKGVFIKSISKNTKNKWVNAGGYKFYFGKKRKPAGPGFNFIKNKLYHMDWRGAVMYGTFKASDGRIYTTTSKGTITGLPYCIFKYKTFIFIDISEQTLWYYKKGKFEMKADVVTGRKGKYDTPTGTFKIRSKQKNVWLKGPTWNSHVDYWMAFKGSSYGIHDASWRSSKQFSNHKTYLKNGSHGCVNMRPKDAVVLYKKVKKGTKVIIQK